MPLSCSYLGPYGINRCPFVDCPSIGTYYPAGFFVSFPLTTDYILLHDNQGQLCIQLEFH